MKGKLHNVTTVVSLLLTNCGWQTSPPSQAIQATKDANGDEYLSMFEWCGRRSTTPTLTPPSAGWTGR